MVSNVNIASDEASFAGTAIASVTAEWIVDSGIERRV